MAGACALGAAGTYFIIGSAPVPASPSAASLPSPSQLSQPVIDAVAAPLPAEAGSKRVPVHEASSHFASPPVATRGDITAAPVLAAAPVAAGSSSYRAETRTFTEEQLSEARQTASLQAQARAKALAVLAPPVPTALRPIDPSALKMTDAQISGVADVLDQFVEEIGGEGQKANDPAYIDRWRQAVPKSDAELRARLGNEMANRIQLQAAQAAYQRSNAGQ